MADDDTIAAVGRFNAHLDQLAEDAGVELTAEDRQQLFGQSIAGGFSEDATVAAFDGLVDYEDDAEDVYDDSYEEGAGDDEAMAGLAEAIGTDNDRLEQQLGRPLLHSEMETATREILEDVRDGRPVDVERATSSHWGGKQLDLDNRGDRVKWMTAAAEERELPGPPEDPDREYDLDNTRDRRDFMAARLAGDEFVDAPEW